MSNLEAGTPRAGLAGTAARRARPVVFISHTKRDPGDCRLARAIAKTMEENDVQPLMAPDFILAGKLWKQAVVRGIREEATHFLVIVSKASLSSRWVRREIGLARSRWKRDTTFEVIPVLNGVAPESCTGFLHRFQALSAEKKRKAVLRALALRLSPLFNASVQGILKEALGTVQHRVPFGGREAELAELDRWISKGNAPAHRLLIAPLGRGKSALLAHWVDHLIRSRPECQVVYYPIRAARTDQLRDLLPELTRQLLAATSRAVSKLDRRAPESIRPALERGVPRGQRLCVVLDGLDELADEFPAELLPPELGENTRVLCALRGSGTHGADRAKWTRALGWSGVNVEVMTLSPLSESQISAVLRSAPPPLKRWASRQDLCQALLDKSGGDPLIVGRASGETFSCTWSRTSTPART